jgi:hypothetical protein
MVNGRVLRAEQGVGREAHEGIREEHVQEGRPGRVGGRARGIPLEQLQDLAQVVVLGVEPLIV